MGIVNSRDPVQLGDRFGHAVSVSTFSESQERVVRLAIGPPSKEVHFDGNSGMVEVYEWYEEQSTEWTLVGEPITDPGFYYQLGHSLKLERNIVLIATPGANDNRGKVNLWWLDGKYWNSLRNPIQGNTIGDDFGYSVDFAVDKRM